MIALRLVAVSPATGQQPEDQQRLIDAARRGGLTLRGPIAAALLGGKVEYTPELRKLFLDWLGRSRSGGRSADALDLTLAMFKDAPLGRRVLMEALGDGNLYAYSRQLADALSERHAALSGMKNATVNRRWSDTSSRPIDSPAGIATSLSMMQRFSRQPGPT